MSLYAVVVVIIFFASCASTGQKDFGSKSMEVGRDSLLEGFPEPKNDALKVVSQQVQVRKFDEAEKLLSAAKTFSNLDGLWKSFYTGATYFGTGNLDKGLLQFMDCCKSVLRNKGSSPEEFRVAGLCLKKIGWYFREKKDYEKAFLYHSFRLHFVKVYGSSIEVHDALISLDVDAYYMENKALSEAILRESIGFAEKVQDSKLRAMALGTSFNNLAGTLYGLERFVEAEKTIVAALDYWTQYEDIAGTEENKVVWAFYGIGDVYEQWANHLKKGGKEFQLQKEEALTAYKKGLDIGRARNLGSDQLESFEKQIKTVEAL